MAEHYLTYKVFSPVSYFDNHRKNIHLLRPFGGHVVMTHTITLNITPALVKTFLVASSGMDESEFLSDAKYYLREKDGDIPGSARPRWSKTSAVKARGPSLCGVQGDVLQRHREALPPGGLLLLL